jgi:hypothetical protein
MVRWIDGRILTLAKFEVSWLHDDLRSMGSRASAMGADIGYTYEDRMRYFVFAWRAAIATHVADDHGAISKTKLRAVILANLQPFDKSKRGNEPCDGLPHVRVNKDGNDGSGWYGAVFLHDYASHSPNSVAMRKSSTLPYRNSGDLSPFQPWRRLDVFAGKLHKSRPVGQVGMAAMVLPPANIAR